MLKEAERNDLCQISLTGLRALVLLGLLANEPHSLEEIRRKFLELNIIEDDSSTDIIRIDMNTLRNMGCEISRADKSTDNKYRLGKHPFSLNITPDEINVLRRAYRKITKNCDIVTLLNYDSLFRKLASNVSDNDIKETLYGLSILKSYKIENIRKYLNYCENNYVLNLLYKSPVHKDDIEMEIFAQNLINKNDKIYLYGESTKESKAVTLNIKRIKKVLSAVKSSKNLHLKPFNVTFKLLGHTKEELESTERILNGHGDEFIIQGEYHNSFVAAQRILSFGASCTVLEPTEFRENIIETLKRMREVYND